MKSGHRGRAIAARRLARVRCRSRAVGPREDEDFAYPSPRCGCGAGGSDRGCGERATTIAHLAPATATDPAARSRGRSAAGPACSVPPAIEHLGFALRAEHDLIHGEPAPTAGSISFSPRATRCFSRSATMPTSDHGPHATDTTRPGHLRSRSQASLLSTSLAAA